MDRPFPAVAISVLLPTVRPWPEIEPALSDVLSQSCEGMEILVLDGDGAGLDPGCAPASDPRLRLLRLPGSDVFSLRAAGLVAARGEILAFSEDHCHVPAGWAQEIVEAHERSTALALVGPVSNHPDSSRRAVDRASFLLTMGSFAPPLDELPSGRLPIPTNLSLKRQAVAGTTPQPGWVEYELLASLAARGELAAAPASGVAHRQSWGALEALRVHFHSGRSYGAAVRLWSAAARREWFRHLPRLPRRLSRLSEPALERGAGGAPPGRADRVWLWLLILANVAGQVAGALTGSGASRRHLV